MWQNEAVWTLQESACPHGEADSFRDRLWRCRPAFACALAVALLACGKREASENSGTEPQPPQSEVAASSKQSAEGLVVFPPDSPQLRQIGVEPVRKVPVPVDEVTAPAKIEVNPNRVSHALLPVPGRIVHVVAKLGDSVVQGQPIVTIEGPALGEAESAFIQAEAGVRQAELSASKADADLSRLNILFERGASAQKDVLAAQTAAALAHSSLDQAHSVREQARQRLELLGLKPGQFQQQATVPAPISGKVLDINVVEGEYHNEVNAPLFTIADLSRVWVSSDVAESDIRYCHIGGAVELSLIAYPDETFRARVTRIADTVDNDSRTIKVTAELENPGGRLRPQMFGRVRYATVAAEPTVWVPEAAVVQLNGGDSVFVEQGPGRFLATPVTLGKRQNGGFAVSKGVTPGQRIVTAGAVYVKAGL
jgi:cobalt-zinc-cadmium efflux system membrane fusion protein